MQQPVTLPLLELLLLVNWYWAQAGDVSVTETALDGKPKDVSGGAEAALCRTPM